MVYITEWAERPNVIVFDGDYFWEELSPSSLQFTLSRQDSETVLFDIISKFISVNDPDLADFNVEVPDFNRMRDKSIKDDPTRLQSLMLAISNIEKHLYHVFDKLKIFDTNKQFSYMFDRFLGKDIVISKIPY